MPTRDPSRWRAALRRAAAALLLAPVVAAAQEAPVLDRTEAVKASQAALGRTVADFTLLDREGRPVKLASFRGRPLLVSFIYTGCFQVCPATSRSLEESVRALEARFGERQFNVVSIGFNQPADSPQALKAFAAQHRIARANWEFLSAPVAVHLAHDAALRVHQRDLQHVVEAGRRWMRWARPSSSWSTGSRSPPTRGWWPA